MNESSFERIEGSYLEEISSNNMNGSSSYSSYYSAYPAYISVVQQPMALNYQSSASAYLIQRGDMINSSFAQRFEPFHQEKENHHHDSALKHLGKLQRSASFYLRERRDSSIGYNQRE